MSEVAQLLSIKTAFEVGAGVDAGCRAALKIDLITPPLAALASEKVIETDFVQRRRRRERVNLAPEVAVGAVGMLDQHHGIPPHQVCDTSLNFSAARQGGLLLDGDGIEIRGVDGKRPRHTGMVGMHLEGMQKALDTLGSAAFEYTMEGLKPLLCFDGFQFSSISILPSHVTHRVTPSLG
jgi:hypothetical protein